MRICEETVRGCIPYIYLYVGVYINIAPPQPGGKSSQRDGKVLSKSATRCPSVLSCSSCRDEFFFLSLSLFLPVIFSVGVLKEDYGPYLIAGCASNFTWIRQPKEIATKKNNINTINPIPVACSSALVTTSMTNKFWWVSKVPIHFRGLFKNK